MKHLKFFLAAGLILCTGTRGSITVPGSDGSDGALNITANTVIDLAQAETAAWDTAPSVAGTGVYDADKWAVVFKYSSGNIDPGVTLSFSNHSSRAPVVWLVDGDVTIDGAVAVNGKNYVPAPDLAEPGPGGFRGGTHFYTSGIGASAGFGVGGGEQKLPTRGLAAATGRMALPARQPMGILRSFPWSVAPAAGGQKSRAGAVEEEGLF